MGEDDYLDASYEDRYDIGDYDGDGFSSYEEYEPNCYDGTYSED